MLKKIVGIMQIIFSAVLCGASIFGFIIFRKKFEEFLKTISSKIALTPFASALTNVQQYDLIIIFVSLFVGIIGILFLLQGIVNLIHDSKKEVEIKEKFSENKNNLHEKKNEFELGNEY